MEYKVISISAVSDGDYNTAFSLLSDERKAYLNTVTAVEKIKASVLGEWLVKRILNESFHINECEILRAEKGKPYIKNSKLFISISHSGDFVCAAVSEKNIGIDIEVIKERDLKITKKLCTEIDEEFINESENTLLAFYKIWTAKEAYFKMLGSGLTNLKSISYKDINSQHFFENNLIITIAE